MSPRAIRLLVALDVLFALSCGGPKATAPQVAEPTLDDARPVNDREAGGALVQLIGSAKTSINLIEFEYRGADPSTQPITKALTAAVMRGVHVRALLDPGIGANTPSVEVLKGVGVDAKLAAPNLVTHNKAVSVDGATLLAGSTNFSDSALNSNHETNVLLHDASATAAFDGYFEQLWASSSAPIPLPAQQHAIVVLGDGQYADAVRALLETATREVRMVMYALTYSPTSTSDPAKTALVQALLAAATRGVAVRVVLEQSAGTDPATTGNKSAAQFLTAGGGQVRFDSPQIITHAKLLVVDDVAVIGSTNWSSSALHDYHATDVVVHSSSVASAFGDYFEAQWAAATP